MDLSLQPIVNIGMLGSVSDGKSTTVLKLTGTKTQRHSSELHRNITIKPGYANMKIYEHTDGSLHSCGSKDTLEGELVHHLSFIDCPGHFELILTMLANIDLMQGAIVIVSAAEPISMKPQLIQHLMAIKIANITNFIICMNKLDLISKDVAIQRKKELDELLNEMDVHPKIIIPMCINKKIGIDYLLSSIMEYFPPNVESTKVSPKFRISRSFDINKNNININTISGGVVGGSLICGKLNIGDKIEIRPGIVSKDSQGNIISTPLKSTIKSLQTDTVKLDSIVPGGLIGIGTDIDPFYCKNDYIVGNMVGLEGEMPPVYTNITIKFSNVNFDMDEWEPVVGNIVNLMISTMTTNAKITSIDNEILSLKLEKPVCIDKNNMIVLSVFGNQQSSKSIMIVGYGFIKE